MPAMQHGGRRSEGPLAIPFSALLLVALVAPIGACTSDAATPPDRADSATTSSAIPSNSPSSTSTTTEPPPTTVAAREFEPLIADPSLPIRDQVEVAYLFHWEVLLDAYRTGDTSRLELAYTANAAATRSTEIQRNVSAGFVVGGSVEHNFEVSVLGEDHAIVVDGYRNYLVRLEPTTGDPLGEPTGEESLYEYEFRKVGDRWLVNDVIRYRLSE
jgi:hypothetical protein